MNFDHPEFLWSSVSEGYFSIFKVEKINQKLLKFITQRVFLAKPTTLNPMSLSVFWPEKVGRFSILIMSATILFGAVLEVLSVRVCSSLFKCSFCVLAYVSQCYFAYLMHWIELFFILLLDCFSSLNHSFWLNLISKS